VQQRLNQSAESAEPKSFLVTGPTLVVWNRALIRRAIVVVALSFGGGFALAWLAIQTHRAPASAVIVHSGPTGEGVALISTSNGNLAERNRPMTARDDIVAEANSIGEETGPQSGRASGSAAVELQLTGQDFQWEVRYVHPTRTVLPRGNPPSAAPSSREIRLPAETDVRLRLKSRDYVYLVTVPDVSGGSIPKSQIALPNHLFTLDFNTGPQGSLVLSGDHLCGLPRPSLDLTAVVQSEEEFRAWIENQGN
jgi:heme/copper-type cytochrome/quinol oxidase subunit 2